MSQTHPIEAALLHPLDVFYKDAGRPLPWHQQVQPREIPEPFRSLLVHNRDMTSTLEQHHGDCIHLRVFSLACDPETLRREVVLCRDRDGLPVEFGATIARLGMFKEPWRGKIVESRRPLGGILNSSGVPYTSRPAAFFRIRTDAFLQEALRLESSHELFGRQNTLRTHEGREIAAIVEILPPARP